MDVATALSLLAEESAQLDELVAGIDPETWSMPTPAAGWSIADQIGHLLWTDTVSVQTINNDPAFGELLREVATSKDLGMLDRVAHDLAALPPTELLDQWRSGRLALSEALGAVDAGAQINWFGPPMRPVTMATARIMETWAHSLDVFDALGREKPASAALAAVCRIGLRTREFAYRSRRLEMPVSEIRVELTMPDGSLIESGAVDAAQRITGTAWAFAAVVTQRRNIEDVELRAEGKDAIHWMSIAQAFAGAPTSGPKPGERVPNAPRVLRVGNASGFYGDRMSAFEEMVEARVDVITGDYLAELTMLILARQKQQEPTQGYAKTFVSQLGRSLEAVAAAGTKVVANAGGMNPSALAAAIRTLAEERGIALEVAHVDGDDLTERSSELGFGEPLAANAYLGGWGITEALHQGAQIVVTGRVTDAAVITGPAAWFHGWTRTDYDQLAGAMAAGHVIECGMQATGGNFAFFQEIEDLRRPGFPIAEIAADGSSVITKKAGTGGAVTPETVLSQLLYEVSGARYAGPDVTLRLDSLQLTDLGGDRVRISGAQGEAPPPDLKVSVTEIGGFRQQITFPLVGLGIEQKAALIKQQYEYGLELSGLPRPEKVEWFLSRTDRADATVEEEAAARLTLVARDANPKVVGRAFANIMIEFALGSIPGFFTDSPPADGSVYGRYRPMYVPQTVPTHTVHFANGETLVIPAPSETRQLEPSALDSSSAGWGDRANILTSSAQAPAGGAEQDGGVQIALGELFGARSGDKGATANIGVWARSDEAWEWLRQELTIDRLRELLPETAVHEISRVELPNLRSLNFVVQGILVEGVAYGARFDSQAKALGEWLRARYVTVPSRLAQQREVGLDDFFFRR